MKKCLLLFFVLLGSCQSAESELLLPPASPSATTNETSPPETQLSITDPALECGKASYYADKFIGRPTASGTPYSATAFTAAHRTLTFGTKLRVTRQDTEVKTIVTVNDRGPFSQNRIIDLSRVAAEKINMIDDGIVSVCIYKIE